MTAEPASMHRIPLPRPFPPWVDSLKGERAPGKGKGQAREGGRVSCRWEGEEWMGKWGEL